LFFALATRRDLSLSAGMTHAILRGVLVPGALLGLVFAWRPLAAVPLTLYPDNPHYFLFRGQPTVLVTSGEHYGAVLNRDFNYVRYLRTLARDGLNLTRTFAGAYVEPPGAFNIASNTLAPAAGRFLCPWARSAQPGYANGGNRFDLTRWDPAYFERLKAFLAEASRRGVVVELNLFCPFYDESQWRLSPLNASNNVNGVGTVARTNVYTLDRHGGLLAHQEAMVRRIVAELAPFDNLYYEICNEPYFGGVTIEWQHHIAEVITDAERGLSVRHLISQNIANGKARVEKPHPAVSIFNFHYASPPDAVPLNYGLNRVIGDNETGFNGTNDLPYRVEAWNFLMAGGGLFNHLDYSFAVGHENGRFRYPATQPGGGNPELRRQFGALRRFLDGLGVVRLAPDADVVKGGVPDDCTARALSRPGRTYAVYVALRPDKAKKPPPADAEPAYRSMTLDLELPPGFYRVAWFCPVLGKVIARGTQDHLHGIARLRSPLFVHDIVLRLDRQPATP